MDVPGTTREHVKLEPGPMAGTLQLTLTRPPSERHDGTLLRAERRALRAGEPFTRLLVIGRDADAAGSSYEVENGVLRVRVPRRAMEPQA